MNLLAADIVERFYTLLLPMLRISALLLTAPPFSNDAFNVRLRVFFAAVLTWLVYPLHEWPRVDPTSAEGLAEMFNQVLIGAVMGLVLQFIVAAFVVAGQAPEGRGWTISILDPTAHHEIDRVHLARGSVATSSTEIRVFGRGHHLVDPDTLEATRSGVRSASVVAGSGAWAEMLTKWLMVDGPRRLDDLDRLGIAANTATHDGQTENDCWKRLAVAS